MNFCGLCNNHVDKDGITIEGQQFHKECLITADEAETLAQGVQSLLYQEENIGSYIIFAPVIPKPKLAKAMEIFAQNVLENRVLALYDCTLEETGEAGFVVTTAGFYSRHPISFDKFSVKFSELESVKETKVEEGSRGPVVDQLELVINGETKLLERGVIPSMKLELFSELAELMFKYRDRDILDATDKYIIIQDMEDSIRLAYIKIVINMFREEKREFGPRECEELECLMTQLNFTQEMRIQSREYVKDPNDNSGLALFEIENKSPRGSQMGIRISLIKDLVRFHRLANPNASIARNKYMQYLREIFGITHTQMECIYTACLDDEKIFQEETDDVDISTNARRLSSKTEVAGLPTSSLYLSGSSIGMGVYETVAGFGLMKLDWPLRLNSLATGENELVSDSAFSQEKVSSASVMPGDEKRHRNGFITKKMRFNDRVAIHIAQDVNLYVDEMLTALHTPGTSKADIEARAEKIKSVSSSMNTLMLKNSEMEAIIGEE